MRLRTLNRLSQVSSAVVTTLLVSAGCHLHKAPATTPRAAAPLGTTNPAWPATTTATTEPATMPATLPSTAPDMTPATMPSTAPATMPTTAVVIESAATMPTTVPATLPSIAPGLLPSTLPATLPSSMPTTQAATTEPTTAPAVPPTADELPPTDDHQIQADAALAEQFDNIAELQFARKITRGEEWPLIWRNQAALLSAAGSLNPKESRFPRLVADAMAQLHDSTGELDALRKAIAIKPEDEFSWNRRLDLILAPMQTARGKIDYLRDVISRSSGDVIVPPDVRAHAAYRCAQLLLERGEEEAATSMIAEALRTCPSNVECLTLRYQMLPPTATRFERCEQLLDILHANPLQLRYSTELANLVAASGLVQESLPWFQLAVATAHLSGDAAPTSMLNWAAELYIGDEQIDAFRLNAALLQLVPNFTPAYFLQLVMARTAGDKAAYTKALQQSTNALSNRVVEACNDLLPPDAAKATTRPINDDSAMTLPDLSAAVNQIKIGGDKVSVQHKQQFIEAVADMALLEGYFAEDADTAEKLIDALAGVLPDNAPELARLRGWNLLLQKKPDDAKAKFATVATQDPLAQLGLVKVMLDSPADRPAAESIGRRLLQDHPSGLIGAMLWEQLHSERVKLITTTQADALRDALTAFPASILKLADRPQSFYAVHVQPYNVGSSIGEPLLAEVSIENLSDYDLTIGPDGVLKTELLFMLHPKVGSNPSYSAFDMLAGPTVLASHSRIDQIVRVDQTPLLGFLNTQVNLQFEVTGDMTTNQTVGKLGGYPVQFVKSFFRNSSPLTPMNEQTQTELLSDGRPEQKITALNILQNFAMQLEHVKDPEPKVQQDVIGLVSAIHHARVDPLQAVAAWAGWCEFSVANPRDRVNIVRDMAESPDWRHRQIALMLANAMEPSLRDQIVDKLTLDPQTSVRAAAVATKGLIALPPEPATQPAPEPAAPPAAQ